MPKEINISDNKGEIKPTEIKAPAIAEQTKELEKKVLEKLPKKKKIDRNILIFSIVAFLTLCGLGLFFYFGIYKVKPVPPQTVIPFAEDFVASIDSNSPFSRSLSSLQKPSEPRTEVSPLNGVLFTKTEMDKLKKRRPVAVMSSNHADARPLSGISSADIVIEANAEGGITRHMAIYWSEGPEKVGSVRSVRQYYLEWASEYSPLFVRVGCASSTDPRVNACSNIHYYKEIADIELFWRWDDGRRYAPHNAYTSIKGVWEKADKYKWNNFPTTIDEWKFKRDAEIVDRGEKSVVKTVFHTSLPNGGKYDAIWTYDKGTNRYFRKVGGQADIDQETNKQISAKNVVIQEVKMNYTGDSKSHIIITTIGEGNAKILQDGKIIDGKWKKKSRTDRTMYYDSSGKEISFNRGMIWIAMVPQTYGKFDIIEQ
ncbi:MAG TPA: DUF3048 domain-containing protein [Candidatus Dojkabacteria bacterium]|nr:DUF3048 domain-containing protein [Candidatus Dojkabacteria bacterium]HQI92693.1 DUF3048 domain-containing protein [Candidatus Dojkabacteria bacterium]